MGSADPATAGAVLRVRVTAVRREVLRPMGSGAFHCGIEARRRPLFPSRESGESQRRPWNSVALVTVSFRHKQMY